MLFLEGFITDITERKRTEAERQALMEILQGVAVTESLQELLELIRQSLAKVIYAENFFVVFYNKSSSLFEEVFAVDKYDPPMTPSKIERGITAYVFRTGEPLLLTQAKFEELAARGEVELVGTKSAIWLGAPLKTPRETIGVIVVQNYEDPDCYSERDREFLASVGVQVSLAVERKRAEQELAQSHEQLRALTAYWQTSFEAERAHIAREIHDEFGQSMTALKMDLTWLARRLPEGDEKVDRIRGMTTLVDDCIALMRRIATELRPGLLDDLGLNAALEWQAVEFSKRSGIPCKFNLPKDDLALDPALNTTLFRIFQETLTNIARHAQATRVSASLKQKEQTLVLTIRDNGRGITEAELINPRSLGLLSLRERATQWGGQTTLRGEAGKGTTVTVRIPLPTSPVRGGKR